VFDAMGGYLTVEDTLGGGVTLAISTLGCPTWTAPR
jgi:hypothetical protein